MGLGAWCCETQGVDGNVSASREGDVRDVVPMRGQLSRHRGAPSLRPAEARSVFPVLSILSSLTVFNG